MQLHHYLNYLGNLYDCPFGNRAPGCPVDLSGFKSFKENLEWFLTLPKEKKDEIVVHHQKCKENRECKQNHGWNIKGRIA